MNEHVTCLITIDSEMAISVQKFASKKEAWDEMIATIKKRYEETSKNDKTLDFDTIYRLNPKQFFSEEVNFNNEWQNANAFHWNYNTNSVTGAFVEDSLLTQYIINTPCHPYMTVFADDSEYEPKIDSFADKNVAWDNILQETLQTHVIGFDLISKAILFQNSICNETEKDPDKTIGITENEIWVNDSIREFRTTGSVFEII